VAAMSGAVARATFEDAPIAVGALCLALTQSFLQRVRRLLARP
jgi:hypothetical protein